MIDPIHSLAFAVQAKPGVYAVLVGSGLSRAAGIPTGWEVTLDLIRKLARLHGGEADSDAEAWYRSKFRREPDYSELLNELAKTPAERQQLLQGYFEPTQAEREEGRKEPTAAHRAIAALAACGFVRVIITTNFDRLMESALSAEGVEPTVLSTRAQVRGALPLVHTGCCLFKVHGDYQDPSIRNTVSELAQYPRKYKALLRRIFDEYGLIVSGWSGEWDQALREALEAASARRFTTYWTTRGPLRGPAERLVQHLQAEVVKIEDADTFFTQVGEYVASIEEFSTPHPSSIEIAVTSLKRYLSEPRHTIRFSDLIDSTVRGVVESTADDSFSLSHPETTPTLVAERLRAYDSVCSTLTALAVVGGAWAKEEHFPVWRRALERLSRASHPIGRWKVVWRDLQRYPATLLLYALGLGAVETNQFEFLNSLLTVQVERQGQDDLAVVGILPPALLFEAGEPEIERPEGTEPRVTVLSQWVHNMLREQARSVFFDDVHFTRAFDKFEILVALRAQSLNLDWPVAVGSFFWRGVTRDRFLVEIRKSVKTESSESLILASGLLGENREKAYVNIAALEAEIAGTGWDLVFTAERMGNTSSTGRIPGTG